MRKIVWRSYQQTDDNYLYTERSYGRQKTRKAYVSGGSPYKHFACNIYACIYIYVVKHFDERFDQGRKQHI